VAPAQSASSAARGSQRTYASFAALDTALDGMAPLEFAPNEAVTMNFETLLALAGTFNVSLLAAVGAVGAREIRAYYNIDRRTAGLTTTANCYAPVINLVRHPLFGRAAEMAAGEDPTLGRVYARAWTAAMRGGFGWW
jgi:beta-glucosidase-like glycosyl hydrolase